MIFAKVKQSLHSFAYRTEDALRNAMPPVLDRVTPSAAANSIRRCGYSLQTKWDCSKKGQTGLTGQLRGAKDVSPYGDDVVDAS